MANVKTKEEFKALSPNQLITYIETLPLNTFMGYVDIDTKIRYFLAKYGEEFIKNVKGTDLFFDGVISQSMYESTYGRSEYAVNANNFAGLKYNSNIHPDYYKSSKGTKWAKFPTPEEGIKNHINALLGSRYKDAREKAKSPEEQILMFIKAGYAQGISPQTYLNQMKGIIKRVREKTQLGRIS
jgi:hypothetical protein